MPIAVISDIHSNLDALQAVLADIDQRGVDQIICLGDVVGYGPEPAACLDLVIEQCSVCLMGNHDYAVLYEPCNFNIGAESACYWTRKKLEAEKDAVLRDRRWDFLGAMATKHVIQSDIARQGEMVFVHGSPRRPINEYVFPDDVCSNPGKLHLLFERFGRLCFVGHTHVPGVFFDTPDFYGTEELENEYPLSDSYKALINVGSIGQPRDRDNRASYVVVDEEKATFIRVPYDVDAVIKKMCAIGEIDEYLASRLRDGR
ncbi:MAG: metallophosphoesterase [Planctomycetes bacterium]|nr:metallophosphoesterase [Planctomycetota bacterium]